VLQCIALFGGLGEDTMVREETNLKTTNARTIIKIVIHE
jgi:hypothetical protein